MRLLEYQGKQIFKNAGILIPTGAVVESKNMINTAMEEFYGQLDQNDGLNSKIVVKAQVPVGGRGKAGGIIIVDGADQAGFAVENMLGTELKGFMVAKVLLEKALDIDAEMYLSCLIDTATGYYTLLFCPEGGMDIEELAREKPERIIRYAFSPTALPAEYDLRNVLRKSLQGGVLKAVSNLAWNLVKTVVEQDLTLAEINPLVIDKNGNAYAADAKIEVDDNAVYRHPELEKWAEPSKNHLERLAKEAGVTYVALRGDIGIIASGAGLAMNTMDLVYDFGHRPANFLETGGGITRKLISDSVQIVCGNEGVVGLIVNLYGGINSLLEAAHGVVDGMARLAVKVPVVVKALGNQQEECWEILEQNGILVEKATRTEDAVAKLLKLMEGDAV